MDFQELSTFLAIVETESISMAAEKLFLSQSTISHRLKNLETELGISLIQRNKGIRAVALTPQGQEFVPLAKQMLSLQGEMRELKQKKVTTRLHIGAVDHINAFVFPKLYRYFYRNNPNIHLHIHTYHSAEIHELLEKRQIDIGFVFSEMHYPQLVSRKLYSTPMCLISPENSPYGSEVHPSELDRSQEIYLVWAPDYRVWHDTWWNPRQPPCIQVNTGPLILLFFEKAENWAIVPVSVARAFQVTMPNIRISEILGNPPLHNCFELRHINPAANQMEAIEQFDKSMDLYLPKLQQIQGFEIM